MRDLNLTFPCLPEYVGLGLGLRNVLVHLRKPVLHMSLGGMLFASALTALSFFSVRRPTTCIYTALQGWPEGFWLQGCLLHVHPLKGHYWLISVPLVCQDKKRVGIASWPPHLNAIQAVCTSVLCLQLPGKL